MVTLVVNSCLRMIPSFCASASIAGLKIDVLESFGLLHQTTVFEILCFIRFMWNSPVYHTISCTANTANKYDIVALRRRR